MKPPSASGLVLQLALRKRVKSNSLQPAGQGVLDGWYCQHVRRSGENKPAGHATPVDLELQGGEEFRHTLDLIQDDALWEVSYEAHEIGLGAPVRTMSSSKLR